MGFSPGQSSTLAVLQRCANGQVGLIGVILDKFGLNMMNDSKLMELEYYQKKDPLFITVIVVVPKKETGVVNLEPNLPVVTCRQKHILQSIYRLGQASLVMFGFHCC